MTTYDFKITDGSGNNSHSFNVVRYDFNENRQLRTWALLSLPNSGTLTEGIGVDWGRKVEGFVLYGFMDGYDEINAVRTLINGEWWEHRPARLYISSGTYHEGQVADFKAYNDRMIGGDANVKYTLVFMVANF
jgi:hypothetical protein